MAVPTIRQQLTVAAAIVLMQPPSRIGSPSNTADQLRSSVACVGFVSCIRLFCGPGPSLVSANVNAACKPAATERAHGFAQPDSARDIAGISTVSPTKAGWGAV